MAQFIKYLLDDGSELWVECLEPEGGVVPRPSTGEKIQEAKRTFEQALESAKLSALMLRKQFAEAQADEVEITFGLKATGEIGNNIFAVGKAGVEANYEVTLKWQKKSSEELDDRIQAIRRRHARRKSWLKA